MLPRLVLIHNVLNLLKVGNRLVGIKKTGDNMSPVFICIMFIFYLLYLPKNIKQMISVIDRAHVVRLLILLFYPKSRVEYACL